MYRKIRIILNPYVCVNTQQFKMFLNGLNLNKKTCVLGVEKSVIERKYSFYIVTEQKYVSYFKEIISLNWVGTEFKVFPYKFNEDWSFYITTKISGLPLKTYESKGLNLDDFLSGLLEYGKSFPSFKYEISIKEMSLSFKHMLIKYHYLMLSDSWKILCKIWNWCWKRKWMHWFLRLVLLNRELDNLFKWLQSLLKEYESNWYSKFFETEIRFYVNEGSNLDVSNIVISYFTRLDSENVNNFVFSKKKQKTILSSNELATVFNFPSSQKIYSVIESIPYIKINENLADEYVNQFLTNQKLERSKHHLILGKTGMGKSTFLLDLIKEDIKQGNGFCVVDPHGDLVDQVLHCIPSNRINDVVVLDPSNLTNPFNLNPLQVESEQERILMVSSMLDIFKKMFEYSWGPRLEYFLRNSLELLMRSSNPTLLSISRILRDVEFLQKILKEVNDPFLTDFFETEFLNVPPKMRAEIISPILNKIGIFFTDPVLRNIFGNSSAKLDLGYLMNNKKIILLPLNKGKIGNLNSEFIGSVIASLLQMKAYNRTDLSFINRQDFMLYIDEFHNFATETFVASLSELRKYRLNLVLATQYLEQLSDNLQKALLGNIGNFTLFRLGLYDTRVFSEFLETKIPPECLQSLPSFTMYNLFGSDLFSYVLNTEPVVSTKNTTLIVNKILKNSAQNFNSAREKIELKLQKWIQTT